MMISFNMMFPICQKNILHFYPILFFQVDLSGHSAAILGQGNVALDVARILLSPIDELRKTDITEHALQTLAESKVKELYLLGRRGPLQVAFTIKELREQLKLKGCKTIWKEEDFKGVEDVVGNLARPRKRLTELMLKSVKENQVAEEGLKCFKPVFFRSPKKFIINDHRKVIGIELCCNKLVGDKLEEQTCVPTGEVETLDTSLVFRSIGYKSISVDDDLVLTPYGTVANDKGVVGANDPDTKELAKLYVAGWLGTGPVGVILHTMGNAFHVAKVMCEDLNKMDCLEGKGGFEVIRNVNHEVVMWNGWEKIDKFEINQGKPKGKPREKICSIRKMLEVAL